MHHFKCSLSLYALATGLLLHYTYGWATFSAADGGYLYLKNYWVTLHLWVNDLMCSLSWLPQPRELLCCTTHMGVQPQVQLIFVRST